MGVRKVGKVVDELERPGDFRRREEGGSVMFVSSEDDDDDDDDPQVWVWTDVVVVSTTSSCRRLSRCDSSVKERGPALDIGR